MLGEFFKESRTRWHPFLQRSPGCITPTKEWCFIGLHHIGSHWSFPQNCLFCDSTVLYEMRPDNKRQSEQKHLSFGGIWLLGCISTSNILFTYSTLDRMGLSWIHFWGILLYCENWYVYYIIFHMYAVREVLNSNVSVTGIIYLIFSGDPKRRHLVHN